MTFYNERLDGVVYPRSFEVVGVFTELCEVIVQGKYTKKIIFYILMPKHPKHIKRSNNKL